MKIRAVFLALLAFAGSYPAYGHQVDTVELEFLQTDGKWKFEGLLDIAYMLPESRGVEGAPPLYRKDVMDAPTAVHIRIPMVAEATMRKLLKLEYGGKTLPWEIRFPDFEREPLELPPEAGGWALMKVEITAEAVPGPGTLTASWHDDQESTLIVIIEEGGEIGLFPISSGMSDNLLVQEAPPGDGAAPESKTPSKSAQSERWIILGYGHVISPDFFRAVSALRTPEGLDHLLFILGLFLLAPRWKPLMLQSVLFTVAHSLTLSLAILGFISLPSQVVEILIAASIAWIGVENLLRRTLKPSRIALVFAFGLLHGLGFASMLRDRLGDLSGKQIALPLISFNIGVELAQITVLVAAFLLLWPLRKWTQKIQVYGSILISLAGLFWMVERILA